MEQIPETLADNWLILLLVMLFGGTNALLGKDNVKNFWIFGWVFRKVRDRRVNAIEYRDRVESAMVRSLRSEVQALAERLDRQERTSAERMERQQRLHDEEMAANEDEVRTYRRETLLLLRYVVEVKRWAIEGIDRMGVDPDTLPRFPDFEEWRKTQE